MSGNGSRTARGVAGERGSSARRKTNDLFERIDANNDGSITRDELSVALEHGEVIEGLPALDIDNGGY
jgi:hypothetical protein